MARPVGDVGDEQCRALRDAHRGGGVGHQTATSSGWRTHGAVSSSASTPTVDLDDRPGPRSRVPLLKRPGNRR
jgi:hypothetical protein